MTKDKKPWKFNDWFKAQHGNRPSKKAVATLRNEVIELEKQLAAKKQEYLLTQTWEDKFNTALYAWQIKDEDKAR